MADNNNIREELLKQRKELDTKLAELDKDKVKFSVDAGIIDRLGRELVSKQETAVSELVKNAYDADATEVTLNFIDSDLEGGTLTIDDNGHGMDINTIRNGFMRLSSTDKIHNPVSPKYNRKKAGRKGIGRFATQRLGKKLTIITQTEKSKTAFKVVINWEDYQMDRDLNAILNTIEIIPKIKEEGTQLIIDNLREGWTIAEINRVFRYVSDLLQPSYLSDRVKNSKVKFGTKEDKYFSVECKKTAKGFVEIIAGTDESFLKKALAIFEGYVNKEGIGYCYIESPSLSLTQSANEEEITPSKERYKNLDKPPKNYLHLKGMEVHFKAYYFIYNRTDYYDGDGIGIGKTELKRVQKFGNAAGGIKLYRNGFRVARYGEMGDDWLDIDQRYTAHSGKDIVPFGNKNIFGFVEIIDEEGNLFEETSSREGLITNEVFDDLVDFLIRAFQAGRRRLESSVGFKKKREIRAKRLKKEKTQRERLQQLQLFIEEKTKEDEIQQKENDDTDDNNNREDRSEFYKELKAAVEEAVEDLDEIAMLRVLAGLGLSMKEFVHEIKQFSPAFEAGLKNLSRNVDESQKELLERLRRIFKGFRSYTSYFEETIENNPNRELEIIEIRDVVREFERMIVNDADKNNIELSSNFIGYDLFTCPMHTSEWISILFNLYSNAKKAIKKTEKKGIIQIIGFQEQGTIMLDFLDNGIGIPKENEERIFKPFFTTSIPSGRGAARNEEMLGSGLGLKILADIIESYGGEIYVAKPNEGFNTCIRIELPKATEEQIKNEENE